MNSINFNSNQLVIIKVFDKDFLESINCFRINSKLLMVLLLLFLFMQINSKNLISFLLSQLIRFIKFISFIDFKSLYCLNYY